MITPRPALAIIGQLRPVDQNLLAAVLEGAGHHLLEFPHGMSVDETLGRDDGYVTFVAAVHRQIRH